MDRPARVLFVIDELDIGGTEQQILELVKRLDRRKYVPMVCCFRPGRVSREIEAAGVPVFTLAKRAKLDVRLMAGLVRLMRRERVDLVQTYLFTANTWARLAAILARVPLIVTSERNVDMWEAPFKETIGRWLDRWTYATTGNSRAVKDYLVKKGLRPERVRVIYNGVDPGRFEEPVTPGMTKAELGIAAHHAVVGLLARLEPQKDPSTFLQAAALVVQKLPAVSFLVIGGGRLQPALESEAQRLGLGTRIVFTGPRRDVARLLAACDVSVMSSVKEGMSNTIMESMAAGKPMVATRVGGNPELIVEGETGFLVPPRDPAALAEAVERLLEDPALAKSMGLQARARRSPSRRWSRRPSSSTTRPSGPCPPTPCRPATATTPSRASRWWRPSSRATSTPTSSGRSRGSPREGSGSGSSRCAASAARWCTARPGPFSATRSTRPSCSRGGSWARTPAPRSAPPGSTSGRSPTC
jgi:glycosyltransferase involved in cell wall biosynthesis